MVEARLRLVANLLGRLKPQLRLHGSSSYENRTVRTVFQYLSCRASTNIMVEGIGQISGMD